MIYRLAWDSPLQFAQQDDYRILKTWKNPKPIVDWQAIPLTHPQDIPLSDVIGLHNIMVCKQALIDDLSSVAGDCFQALSVIVDNETYSAIHIICAVDCLHPEASQFRRFKNRNIGVEHYVLQADCVANQTIFTVPDDGYSAIFVSEQVKQIYEAGDFSGLEFIAVELA